MLFDTISLEQAFTICSRTAMVGWIILAFLPRRWPALNAIPVLIIPLLLSVAYCAILFPNMGDGEGGFSSLAGVKALFTSDTAVLAGWIHYLAFDLLIGTIIAKKADEIGLHRIVQIPILAMTLLFGPAGYLLFQLTRGGLSLFGKRG